MADTSAGRPQPTPDASAAVSLLESLSMLRSVREDSGSLDARTDSAVLLLATDDYLNVAVRSGEIDDSVSGVKLVPVPHDFGTSPNAWTLKRVHIDFQLTAAHMCAENVTLPAGTYISCTASGENLHYKDRGSKPTPCFYAIPPHLAFEWTAARGAAVVGKQCTAEGGLLAGGKSSGGGGDSSVLSPAIAEWNSAVGSGNRALVEKSKVYTPVY